MIAANEAVGALLPRARRSTRCGACTRRPTEERVAQLAELLGAYGIKVDVEAGDARRSA